MTQIPYTLKNFFVKSLELLSEKLVDDYSSFNFIEDVVDPVNNEYFRLKQIEKISYRLLIVKYMEAIRHLEETPLAIRTLVEDDLVPPVLYKTEQNRSPLEIATTREYHIGPFFQLISILIDYCEEYKTVVYSDIEFQNIYRRYERQWLRPFYTVKILVPLLGFSSDLEQVDLSKGQYKIQIRRFSDKEKSLNCPNLPQIWNFSLDDYYNSQFIIQCKYRLYRNDLQITRHVYANNARQYIKKCITALRIIKPGEVGGLITLEILENPDIILQSGGELFLGDLGLIRGQFTFTTIHKPYHLKKHDVKKLNNFFNILTNANYNKKLEDLNTGLERFIRLYVREKPDDKVVDSIISLESMLLNNSGYKDEIKSTLAYRAAKLLSKEKNVDNTMKKLKRIYDVRSSIIHEGKPDLEKIARMNLDIYTLASDLEQINREIIRAYLKNYVSNAECYPPLNKFNNNLEYFKIIC